MSYELEYFYTNQHHVSTYIPATTVLQCSWLGNDMSQVTTVLQHSWLGNDTSQVTRQLPQCFNAPGWAPEGHPICTKPAPLNPKRFSSAGDWQTRSKSSTVGPLTKSSCNYSPQLPLQLRLYLDQQGWIVTQALRANATSKGPTKDSRKNILNIC